MSVLEQSGGIACPGCLAGAGDTSDLSREKTGSEILLSLPAIHCAACISGVERDLLSRPEVRDARVNLTRKRAVIHAAPGTEAKDLADYLTSRGYEALPLDAAGLDASESDTRARDLLMRLGVSGFAMMNVMLLSVAVWSGASDATRDLFHWISAAIALPTIAFAGQPFFRSGWSALAHGRLNMDVPISLAILLAAGMSLFETVSHGHHAYFDAALSLTFFLLAGRYLDQRTRSVARSAAAELAALESPTALRLDTADRAHTVPASTVEVGDRILVRPGGRVPVDGEILSGESELDRSILTGETEPAAVAPGTIVRAGEVNLTGPFTLRADAVGGDTALHALSDLVSVAEAAKGRYNSLADRAARIYAPAVHLLALCGFLVWLWLTQGDVRVALNIAVALLIITCPCALGLAVPAVSTVASGRLYKAGMLIKSATALERLAEVEVVALDKTGTLTMGKPVLANADAARPLDLALAAALAEGSAHPRSLAIADAAQTLGATLPKVQITDLREIPGHGIEGQWQGQTLRLGRDVWAGGRPGQGTVLGGADGIIASFQFEDTLRPGAAELVTSLRDRGLGVVLISGDAAEPVAALARKLGIERWHAGVLPAEKVEIIREYPGKVLMIGDGLNDTGALAAAHVSIAPASALEAARVAADVVLTRQDLAPVDIALGIGSAARRRILQNFAVAAGYNAISIPLAFAGLASPLLAAIAMSTSSIVVSLNAMRLRS